MAVAIPRQSAHGFPVCLHGEHAGKVLSSLFKCQATELTISLWNKLCETGQRQMLHACFSTDIEDFVYAVRPGCWSRSKLSAARRSVSC